MNFFWPVCAVVGLLFMLVIIVLLDSIEEMLRKRLPEPPPAERVRMPWESDGSNLNIARPGGDFPDQM